MIARLFIFLLACLTCQAQPWWVRPLSGGTTNWLLEVVVTNATAQNFTVASLTPATLVVEWGDGAISNLSGTVTAIHSYPAATTNILKIRGTARRITFGLTAAELRRLKRVIGPIQGLTVSDLRGTFLSCDQMTSIVSNMLENSSSTLTNLQNTWNTCNVLTNAPVVSNLTLVSTLAGTWATTRSISNYPIVSTLTNVTTLANTWIAAQVKGGLPDVSTLTKVTTLANTWQLCLATNFPAVTNLTLVTSLAVTWANATACRDFPDVSTLTNVTTLNATWASTLATNYPSVAALTNATTMSGAWSACTTMTNIPPISDSTNLLVVQTAFEGNHRLICASVPFWDPARFPNINTNSAAAVDNCYWGCTNLSDYATIPAAFK